MFIAFLCAGLGLSAQSAHAEPATAQPQFTPAQADIYNPPKPKDGFRYPDCFCTDSQGERIELGKTVCLTIGSRSFTARCVMATNNPFWRQVSEGCPSV
ncbi:MAG: hypothetical protein AAF557_10840 [Pseudomonadota bacterium]